MKTSVEQNKHLAWKVDSRDGYGEEQLRSRSVGAA